jgi:phage gpG-like protein
VSEFGAVDELVGSFAALEIDDLSFEEAAVRLNELALYIDNVDLPLRGAKRIARDDMKDRFESETAPDGTRWFELDPTYSERKERAVGSKPILTREGALKKAATSEEAWSISGESLFFNTSSLPEYWRVHQQGSEGFGVTFVKIIEHTELVRTPSEGDQNIPPRPFIGLSSEAEGKILELFDIWFSEGLAQASKKFAISSVGTLHARTPQGRFGERIIF